MSVRIGLLFLWAVLACGCEENNCDRMCARLEDCGLVPSPLGQNLDDCIAQCEETRDTARDRYKVVLQCVLKPVASSAWCGSDEGPTPHCAAIAQCLTTALTNVPVLGNAQLQVTLVPPVEESAELPVPGDESTSCIDTDSEAESSETGLAVECGALGNPTVQFFAEQSGSRMVSEETACGHASLVGHLFERDLTPGVVSSGAILRGQGAAEGNARAALAPYCSTFYGVDGVLKANETGRGLIAVAAGRARAGCEIDAEACRDGIDNDADALVDCSDLSCAESCNVSATDDDAGVGH